MSDDERAIRDLLATWHRATAAGDLPSLLTLMADDVVYLGPGRPPMRGRDAFAAAFRTATERHRIASSADVRELDVVGGRAYCWCELTVTVTPHDGGPPRRLAGPVLTIFRKERDGSWVLARDANMLTASLDGGRPA